MDGWMTNGGVMKLRLMKYKSRWLKVITERRTDLWGRDFYITLEFVLFPCL